MKYIKILLAALSAFYLANIGLGWFEFIPDTLPFIGNIDEFIASVILVAAGRGLGIDVTGFLGKGKGVSLLSPKKKGADAKPNAPASENKAESDNLHQSTDDILKEIEELKKRGGGA